MAHLELAAGFGAADAAKEQDLRGYYPMAARVLADEVSAEILAELRTGAVPVLAITTDVTDSTYLQLAAMRADVHACTPNVFVRGSCDNATCTGVEYCHLHAGTLHACGEVAPSAATAAAGRYRKQECKSHQQAA